MFVIKTHTHEDTTIVLPMHNIADKSFLEIGALYTDFMPADIDRHKPLYYNKSKAIRIDRVCVLSNQVLPALGLTGL